MSALRIFITALVAACSAVAQQQRPCAGTTTLASQADATPLASCPTFDGDIVISTTAAEPINIPNVRQITGALSAIGAVNLTSLSADSLASIGGMFQLENARTLSTLSFPFLNEVQEINWVVVPALFNLDFSEQGVQFVKQLTIRDTALQNLDGINLKTADSIELTNNGGLNRVSMQITNLTNALLINANGNNQLQALFPNLKSAMSIDVSDIKDIDISSLQFVNATASFRSSASLESLAAPNLTMVGGLAVYLNAGLTNISFPVLQQCNNGPLAVAGNPELGGTVSFPSLEIVRGAAIFNGGKFENVALPKLQIVLGTMTLNSTELSQATCDHYTGIQGRDSVIRGGVKVCNSTEQQQSGSPTSSGSSSNTDGGSGSTTSTGAASHVDSVALSSVGFAGLIAAMLGMI